MLRERIVSFRSPALPRKVGLALRFLGVVGPIHAKSRQRVPAGRAAPPAGYPVIRLYWLLDSSS
jgi:hypothetical protein